MGKHNGKKKKQVGGSDFSEKQNKDGDRSPSTSKAIDKDTEVFISMSQDLKDEGNKLFQKRDYEGAMLKYEKALKLLPRNHIDVAYLRSNNAACYMQMGLSEYPRAVHECNLALEVAPKYSKALLKRARCYEALSRLELALRDVNSVLSMEPNNLMALEIVERVKSAIGKKGDKVDEKQIELAPKYVETPCASPPPNVMKEKKKKKSNKVEEKNGEEKVVVEDKVSTAKEEEPKKMVKLVFGEDIRWAHLPINCSLLQLREAIRERFSCSKAIHIKYRDQEGDLVTITTNEELKWAEALANPQGSVRLYVVEVNPEQDLFYDRVNGEEVGQKLDVNKRNAAGNGTEGRGNECGKGNNYIDDWIIRFAQLFKNHVGFDSDDCLDIHDIGVKLYSEAMEETVTCDEAQDLFDMAAEKFQEMAALALFNWGNVHMSRARKRIYFTEDASREFLNEEVNSAYDWAQKEYMKAGRRYKEALEIKPDFHEGHLALGQQQFEQARLSWYYALDYVVDLETWALAEVLPLYNSAEDNMERGMQMWEEFEQQRLNELSKINEIKIKMQNMNLNGQLTNIATNEAAERAASMRSQINLLWGTMLYERSIVEHKLDIPLWHECLEVSIEKFELAGASSTDIAVMVKNHSSNSSAAEGFGFKIDEIVQAWNEMYDAKRWQSGVPSFRLEPLFRRRIPQLYHALEHL